MAVLTRLPAVHSKAAVVAARREDVAATHPAAVAAPKLPNLATIDEPKQAI